ncbi:MULTISPECIES: DUF4097 family beta strand repeat-containing protein [unclassified Enterococcus]|uniref:DUF4097 family beta strand repeat-containing protein n=1 Tax=unclassified Enterococcus TaxID=2608891 RepID=UPI001CE0EB7E|nr:MULTISPECIES: DUF4097 family beta strand repeat-containing protein [unclassified Enterococcus]MCA5013883.1 DUF4097 family beta strand repeat protein [Enterococcus sp. S23]MCA5017343.1 DUF4097 family beta strand repeat protein [Enterococcus sp. S22(2020)]
MKKTTAFFLTIGVVTMIIGGIGSAVYFRRAEQSMTDTKKESYTVKKNENLKEIHLSLAGNAEYYISTESTNKVVMNTRSYAPISIKSALKVDEKNGQLLISANGNRDEKKLGSMKFDFFSFDRGSSVSLTIPDNAERIIVDGKASGRINLSGINAKNITVKTDNADVDANSLNTEKLALETTNGYLNVYTDVHADKATFKTTNGDINLNDFAALNWSAITTSGDISLESVKGTSTIETMNGDINASNLKGEATIKNTNGSFDLYGSDIPKLLNVTTQRGDINLYTDEILYDIAIHSKTQLGDSTIFGKERSSFKRGKGSRVFDLQSNSGDISIEGPVDSEDDE